jgi:hypothetical protein
LVDVVAGEPAGVVVVVSEAEGKQFAQPVVELAGEDVRGPGSRGAQVAVDSGLRTYPAYTLQLLGADVCRARGGQSRVGLDLVAVNDRAGIEDLGVH